MHRNFEVVTLVQVVFLIVCGNVSGFRIKKWRDPYNQTNGYVDVLVENVTYPLGHTCFRTISGSPTAYIIPCKASLRVCLFTNTTNMKGQQRHLHGLCRPGNGRYYPDTSNGVVRAIESDDVQVNELSSFAFDSKGGEIPFVGAFPKKGRLNLIVSVGLVKLRPAPGKKKYHQVIRDTVGSLVSTRLYNTSKGETQLVVVPNTFCASWFSSECYCQPLLRFNITWRVRCAPGFYPRGRCGHGRFNGTAKKRKPLWSVRTLFPQSTWTYYDHPYTRSRGLSPTYAPAAVSQLVTKSSSKRRRQNKIAVALGVLLAFIVLAVIVCGIVFFANRCRTGTNGHGSQGNGRALYHRMTSKSAPFLESESFSAEPIGNTGESG